MLERDGTDELLATTTADPERPLGARCPSCGAITSRDGGFDHDQGASSHLCERPGQALVAEAALARARETAARLRVDAGLVHGRGWGGLGRPGTRTHRQEETKPSPPVGDGPVAFIVEEDHELAEKLPERHREVATRLLCARVLAVARGSWAPPRLSGTSYGLLLLDGLVARRVEVAGALAMEILGPGDIVRPPEDPPLADAAPQQAAWEVLQPARLAVLDERITALAARWPELSLALSDRLARRSQRLSYLLAVSHLRRIEDRLLGTLWYLAASWGRGTPHGLALPISLTHQALGELAGAQRPSVSLALAALRDRRLVSRMADGTYVLSVDRLPWQQPPLDPLAAAEHPATAPDATADPE
jgi:CRP-like cAMP-binding protein